MTNGENHDYCNGVILGSYHGRGGGKSERTRVTRLPSPLATLNDLGLKVAKPFSIKLMSKVKKFLMTF